MTDCLRANPFLAIQRLAKPLPAVAPSLPRDRRGSQGRATWRSPRSQSSLRGRSGARPWSRPVTPPPSATGPGRAVPAVGCWGGPAPQRRSPSRCSPSPCPFRTAPSVSSRSTFPPDYRSSAVSPCYSLHQRCRRHSDEWNPALGSTPDEDLRPPQKLRRQERDIGGRITDRLGPAVTEELWQRQRAHVE